MHRNSIFELSYLPDNFMFPHNQYRMYYLHTPECLLGSAWVSVGVGSWVSLEHCSELVQTRQPEDWLAWQMKALEATCHLELLKKMDELEQRKMWRTYAGQNQNAPYTGKTAPEDQQQCKHGPFNSTSFFIIAPSCYVLSIAMPLSSYTCSEPSLLTPK